MLQFVEEGWAFGALADAATKADDKGAAVRSEAMINGLTANQMTESEQALQATIKGTRM